ncbi:hypothetical protein LCGC14_2280910 [marine sediment metagenome]|uniref:Uncharacterized protein n=1 Tax=marine sediment metagenome TaxID=412755 RepID=A0A0F9F6N3_9ZZZZ
MNHLEVQLRDSLSRLPNDESRLRFLQDGTYAVNPEACWGQFVVNTCNRLAIEIMRKRYISVQSDQTA